MTKPEILLIFNDMKVKVFSKGKNKNRNEDSFAYNKNTFVVADGATDKSGKLYKNKTGGEIVSKIITTKCLKTKLNDLELVNYINKEINDKYQKLNIIKEIKNPRNRFTGGFICARLLKEKLVITYLGDLGFRINGQKIYQEIKTVDLINSKARAEFIKKTGDIEGGRKHIFSLLEKQFSYQNNSRHKLGYGVVDGRKTPKKFIKIFEYPIKKIKTLELFTDGYFDIPKKTTLGDWEKMYKKIEKEDPFKYKKYLSTKSNDDRTIMIINF